MVVEKHVGLGDYEPVGEAEVKVEPGGNPVPPAFDALGVREHAVYRAFPKGFDADAAFYRLEMDGSLTQMDQPPLA